MNQTTANASAPRRIEVRPHGGLLEVHAREKAGMPEGWALYSWECLPPDAREPGVYVLTGAVAPLKTRGPGKGHPNWGKRDPATVRVAYITPAEHAAWVAGWAARTGLCPGCMGEGRVVAGVSVEDGTTYRSCEGCGGTGRADVGSEVSGG